ncbi:polysaccharide biosynthesis tyrosine autokinase [Massilia aerilata]|uniref:Polysaccharide biosynthesis tyrosine autokinase n=1 Tax=Massilia aerilata TaxID=453817 RepID=A0ABW0RWB7_9BURK
MDNESLKVPMNQPVSNNVLKTSQVIEQDNESLDLASYIDLVVENRWLIVIVASIITVLGVAYSFIAMPVYQSNILVQVEDGAGAPGMMLGDLAGALEMKSAATAEIEILRSRFVVTRAVTNAQLDLTLSAKRFPIIGSWIARGKNELSEPGLFGFGGFTWGAEKINVSMFTVPTSFEGERFVLTAMGNGAYVITHAEAGVTGNGHVGETLLINTKDGAIKIHVQNLGAKKGAQFFISRAPLLETVERLQKSLTITEKGKQSGIIGVSLEGTDRERTAATLNEIGHEYIRQNVERKSEEAQKSLAFLEKQLPELKRSLEQAEATYNAMRNSRGTVDLSEEAKSVLQQSVLSQTKLIELKQRRDELLTRYQESNPLVRAVDQQIHTLNGEIAGVNNRIKKMPSIEQDVLRLTRDIKVNTDLYTSLLNSAQQLKLVKASKVGNVRLLDEAVIPLRPIRPQSSLVISMAMLMGIIVGIGCAFIRRSFFGGIEDPSEIEKILGLTISAAIPHSARQESLYSNVKAGASKISVLAKDDPADLAIESLRSFRTSLQFSMLGAKNKIVMITGPTPGVGKSFISVNFAAVIASAGKKVLLIDGDLRKGYLQRYFGLHRRGGLSEVIAGSSVFASVVHKDVLENVDFLSTGEIPPQPSELLEHSNFAMLLQEVMRQYDLIVIDTAPVLAVTDGMVIAPYAGTIFNVVRGNVSTMGEIEESVKRIQQAGHNVAGLVFNDLRHRKGGYGSKYGKYRYAQYKY